MLRIIFLNIYCITMFFVMRYLMQLNFLNNAENSFYKDDIAKMYEMGFIYDLRACSIVFSLLIILTYANNILNWGGAQI